MFWTRNAASPAPAADANGSQNVAPSTPSRSMGFFASLDVRGASESRLNAADQSAGENAREHVADGSAGRRVEDQDGDDGTRGVAALPPSYILSEQRRLELLQAARATRTSWVDGAAAADRDRGGMQWANGVVAVPAHFQDAIEQIGAEMQALMASLEQLKTRIIPNDMLADGRDHSAGDKQGHDAATTLVTIAEELRTHEDELESWRRVHLVQGKLSPLQRKRLTASDKEMLFLLAFQDLLALLKHPLAAETVYQIQTFVKKFEHWNLETMLRHRALQDRPGGHVQAFIDKLVLQLQRTGAALFSATSVEILSLDDDEDQLLHETLEAFLMEKLYAKALTPSRTTEREDEELRERLESLSFVEFRHLDLPIPASPEIEAQWQQLTELLGRIALFPSPRRKMDCVMRVCQELTTLLSSLHASGKFPSADEFLPGLIYLLLKANPRQLKRSVHLILEYRRPSRLVSEPGYFFTHLVSSVAFLEQVNGDLLTITPEEFENGLRQSKTARLAQKAAADPVAAAELVLLQKEDDARGPHSDNQSSHDDGGVELLSKPQLPTVLEVRAKRLAVLHGQAVCTQ